MKMIRQLIACTCAAAALAISLTAGATDFTKLATYEPWPEATVEAFRSIPVQEGGRIKPMDAWAQFKLLSMNAKRSLWIEAKRPGDDEPTKFKIGYNEWALDCFFRPDIAKQQKIFDVKDYDALTRLGIELLKDENGENLKKKRDRYSYNELFTTDREIENVRLNELETQADRIRTEKSDQADWTSIEHVIIGLHEGVTIFDHMVRSFAFARGIEVGPGAPEWLAPAEGGTVRFQEFFGKTQQIAAWVDEYQQAKMAESMEKGILPKDIPSEEMIPEPIRASFDRLQFSPMLLLFPPTDPKLDEWESFAALARNVDRNTEGGSDRLMKYAGLIEDIARAPVAESAAPVEALRDAIVAKAEERTHQTPPHNELRTVNLEVAYYKADLFYRSINIFVILILAWAVAVLTRRDSKVSKIATRIAFWGTLVPVAMMITGMTMRSIILARPPVATLYETLIFITTASVIVLLVIEAFDRQRIALGGAVFLGCIGLLLSGAFEVTKSEDTMGTLQAVLMTNFWLATHVPSVLLGYAAGIVAALISAIYVAFKLFGRFSGQPTRFTRDLTKFAYGVICFGLLFSLVGTVLGGLWANDSWGRFWGWDPKENGALMIVLCFLAILHARLGGYIKEWGLHLSSLLTANVVLFSWFHVNLLGVGLHSYGFTSGLKVALFISYGVFLAIFLVGAVLAFLDRIDRRRAKELRNAEKGADPGPGGKRLANA